MNKWRFVQCPSGALIFMALVSSASARMTCRPVVPVGTQPPVWHESAGCSMRPFLITPLDKAAENKLPREGNERIVGRGFSLLWLHWYNKMETGCLFSLMLIIITVAIDLSLPTLLSFPNINYCTFKKRLLMVFIYLQGCNFMLFSTALRAGPALGRSVVASACL